MNPFDVFNIKGLNVEISAIFFFLLINFIAFVTKFDEILIVVGFLEHNIRPFPNSVSSRKLIKVQSLRG